MADELEGANAPVEEKTPTSEKGAGTTQPEAESTVDITKTEEFRKALDKALGKGLESTNRQLSQHQAETKAAKAESEALKNSQKAYEEAIRDLEKRLEEHYDPDELKAYRLELREKKTALKEVQVEQRQAEIDGMIIAQEREKHIKELQTQYNVPADVLEICTNAEQMDRVAKVFPEIKEEEPEKKPKFESGISSGGGMTDEVFLQSYANGKSQDHERANKLLGVIPSSAFRK